MTKRNYNALMENEISRIISSKNFQAGIKPKLLLHVCCAPCSSSVLERLVPVFSIVLFYYNPNIYPEAEYLRRLKELKKYCAQANLFLPIAEELYNPAEYYAAVKTDEEPELKEECECGERCRRCYEFRIKKAYQYAAEHEFDYITTTLSVSPYKDASKINEIGRIFFENAAEQKNAENGGHKKNVRFLYADFKKKNGFLRSLQLSEQFGLYRQDYCGCEYSIRREKNV
ncbi:MAG: epoxyqueuosine reductase QueH [Bacteroides sp.]|nr:epoxyqueuosine reductase QueH [Prevotella sp.]MCM1408824.1 epoxyqueuosine reductase QueH [Treponema brennaborense]MCM1470604.1 epoxyqueuosine reductase QueH [Bacteroides sp.]